MRSLKRQLRALELPTKHCHSCRFADGESAAESCQPYLSRKAQLEAALDNLQAIIEE